MDTLKTLERALAEGRISRRDFLMQATALGATAALSTGLLGGPAHAATPKKGGHLRAALGHGSTTDSLDPATYENGFMSNGLGYAIHNHVADVNTNSQVYIIFQFENLLYFHSCIYSLNGAVEHAEGSVTHILENFTGMFINMGLHEVAVPLNQLSCFGFIILHKSGITHHIGEHNCGKFTCWRFCHKTKPLKRVNLPRENSSF